MSYTRLAIGAGLDIDPMYSEQVIVFVNPRFLTLMNLRTESNANSVSRLYGVKKDDIILAEMQNELEK